MLFRSETPPSPRAEGLLFLHGLESNPGSSLQTEDARVQLDVPVAAPLVLEEAAAVGALERQLVAVDLLVPLQVAQADEGLVAELARVR